MNQARPQPAEDPTPSGPRPGSRPVVTSARLLDHWDDDRWRGPVLGAALAVLTLPAIAMVLVGLLVLAVQGVATWLVVTAAALVTTLLGALGAAVAVRRGHPGVVHRLGLASWVWGVAVVVLAVALALSLDAPERVAVAVLLILGGTYTVVLGAALWGAARVLPAPADVPADPADGSDDPGRTTPPGGGPTVDEVPTQVVAPDDDELAEWPEWGGNDPDRPGPRGTGERRPDGHRPEENRGATNDGAQNRAQHDRAGSDRTGAARPSQPGPAGLEDVVDAEVVEPGPPAGRRTPAVPARRPAVPTTPTSTRQPRRRSVTSGGTGPAQVVRAGDPAATERIARQDGEDGPPTQRLPPVEL